MIASFIKIFIDILILLMPDWSAFSLSRSLNDMLNGITAGLSAVRNVLDHRVTASNITFSPDVFGLCTEHSSLSNLRFKDVHLQPLPQAS